MEEGWKTLGTQTEHDFKAPPPETDKLYMAIGDKGVIEVAHPSAPQDSTSLRYFFILLSFFCNKFFIKSIINQFQLFKILILNYAHLKVFQYTFY